MATQSNFAEQQMIVDSDLKATARRRDQRDRRDGGRVAGEQFVRQTDGVRGVVSLDTVFNADVDFRHKRPLG